MRTINIFLIFLLLISCVSCQSCFNNFYAVHEKQTPLNISFSTDKDLVRKVKIFIDSISNKLNNQGLPCNPTPISISQSEKILYLSQPCECYLVNFAENLITISGVYIPTLDKNAWILVREYIPSTEVVRIENRFTSDILNKVDQ